MFNLRFLYISARMQALEWGKGDDFDGHIFPWKMGNVFHTLIYYGERNLLIYPMLMCLRYSIGTSTYTRGKQLVCFFITIFARRLRADVVMQ